MHRLPERIEGPRLILSRWRTGDAEALGAAAAASAEHLRPWMAWADDEPLDIDERRNLIAGWQGEWERGTDAVYGAFLGDIVVGGCGLHRRNDATGALHIGYWVHVDHLRRGYATEIAGALTTAGFAVPGVARIHIQHASTNTPSRAIPEVLGYTFLGELPLTPESPDLGEDVVVGWSIEAADWRGRPAG